MASILRKSILVYYFVLEQNLFLEAHRFPQASLLQDCFILEQIMSANKHPCISLHQIKAVVYMYQILNSCFVSCFLFEL